LINEFNEIELSGDKDKLDNDQIYEAIYGKSYDNLIIAEMPDFSNCLKNHNIREILRAKMVDWKIEVFYNFSHVNEETYFRSIAIMD
jgi:hypothetical protein